MSNAVTGQTYAQIIDRVVVASQNDFEESGVDQQTLQELKEIWQKKLSGLHVAQMPWDPAPPPPQISNPPTVPSNDAKPMQSSQMPVSTGPPSQAYNNPRVKAEAGFQQPMQYPMNGYNGSPMNGSIHRAAHLIHEGFGEQGQASINAAYRQQNNNVALPGQQRPPINLQMPANRQQQQQQAAQQRAQPPPHASSVHAAQTDGAADSAEDEWKALVAARRAQVDDGPGGRVAMDGMLRAAFEAKANIIESGLMMPFNELPAVKNRKKNSKHLRAQMHSSANPFLSASTSAHAPHIPQLDGELDDEDEKVEHDDEAINSDLDDPEDDLAPSGDDEGPQGDTMICTYDKVQRVKNKWKCTLKDGVLSTGGRDYLFHKATGEFEW
ncbi:transcription factor IIA, alpha/beta subunit [Saccharata proteae CBS 121410]|uniref:Transcription factor IIA, alpha/beta subunit n=1 Tax=Saccharata proteae CBS 121410 TaxID=1314787 RepID=A0A9P4I0G4_9PEZI|nr:transcription factor IIA, alpha/beta subunit [Saccharata proteae CBS 121410]